MIWGRGIYVQSNMKQEMQFLDGTYRYEENKDALKYCYYG